MLIFWDIYTELIAKNSFEACLLLFFKVLFCCGMQLLGDEIIFSITSSVRTAVACFRLYSIKKPRLEFLIFRLLAQETELWVYEIDKMCS